MSGLANRWGLTQVRTFPTWPSSGKKFVPDDDSTDIEIAPPGGADVAYWAFPDLAIDDNNDLWLIYVRSVAHSGGTDVGSGTYIQKFTGNNLTPGTPIYTVDSNIDPIGGPTIGFSSGGRIITFHTDFADSEGLGERQPFFRISDDQAVSFTDFTHLTTDFPDPGAVYGPGKSIHFQGIDLKPMYGRTTSTGNRGIFIYKSLDRGASWTLHGTVIPFAASADYEEPYLCVLQNNILLCVIKSETLDISVSSYSLDGGVHWSFPKFVFNSEGKNVGVCSPSGTVLAVGRQFPNTDWRTIYTSSPDGGKTWDAEAYADDRTSMYMYGGGVWHPGIGKAVVAYATDSNFPSGPCKIIIKTFSEVSI